MQNSSIDLIISGQAFHWFDLKLTKFEWQRILKPNGFVALFWNSRLRDLDAFQKAYETLIFFLLLTISR
ncbi:MAG: methyltransferase domain-containing protein [Candidatus Marinimicrobia bacterium]|nr:methyltransferase domain-containing protein [Candidatus Neomarinimicrobiota bacterium]